MYLRIDREIGHSKADQSRLKQTKVISYVRIYLPPPLLYPENENKNENDAIKSSQNIDTRRFQDTSRKRKRKRKKVQTAKSPPYIFRITSQNAWTHNSKSPFEHTQTSSVHVFLIAAHFGYVIVTRIHTCHGFFSLRERRKKKPAPTPQETINMLIHRYIFSCCR